MTGLLFSLINHPLAIGLILLIQTLTISLFTGIFRSSYWFSYILFLVFMGGILVLFIYVTSLASNEIFSISRKGFIIATIVLSISLSSAIIIDSFTFNILHESLNFNNNRETCVRINLIKLYTYPSSLLTLVLVVYLLLTLIVVVKITNVQEGPLRQIH